MYIYCWICLEIYLFNSAHLYPFLISVCKIRWWIYRPFILECHFDLSIWNNVVYWKKSQFIIGWMIITYLKIYWHIFLIPHIWLKILKSYYLQNKYSLKINFCQIVCNKVVLDKISSTTLSWRKFHQVIFRLWHF